MAVDLHSTNQLVGEQYRGDPVCGSNVSSHVEDGGNGGSSFFRQ